MSQTLSASTLLAVPLAPLVGSILAGVWGTSFGGNRIGRRLSHTFTILGVLVVAQLRTAALQADVVARALNLTDELLHNAAREMEAVMFERVLDRLRESLPDLVTAAIRDHLQHHR